ncbi:MAG: HEAT repeat domain-containing protein [Proteobacteria bacterium]|nr:HEAT repeat domain-containing protein [Pseudomonadota bacterium]
METTPNRRASSREELQVLADVALELQKSFKGLDYYNEGHPALSELLTKSFNSITERLQSFDNISLIVKRRGFFSGFHQVGKDIVPLVDLARDLYIRGVRKIFLLNGLKQKDLNTFLYTLHNSPRVLQERGGIDAILVEQGVGTIWVNEISYDKLIGKDLDYRGETDEVASHAMAEGHESKLPESSLTVSRENTKTDPEAPLADDKDVNIDLKELLMELKQGPDKGRLLKILGLIIPIAREDISHGELDLSLEILRELSNFIDTPADNSAGLEASILTTICEVASLPMITHLIERLCQRDNALDTVPVLLKIGDASLDRLLDMMADRDDLHTRKHIAFAIRKFGRQASAKVCSRLSDERWFVVRNLVSLLGEVGTPEDIAHFEKLLSHGDERVRKEVIRTLGKIGGIEGARLILNRFDQFDRSLHHTAVFSLGLLGEDIALPLLRKILNRKGFMSAEEELRAEAVVALGKLKNIGAVPDLESLLISERLFHKESDTLRIAAAKSLVAIGGKDALHAIDKGTHVKRQAVKDTCAKFLKQIAKTTRES